MDNICIVSQLNSVIDSIECQDIDKLNNIINERNKYNKSYYINDYNVILQELKNLNKNLKKI